MAIPDPELISIYRGKESTHVNPVFVAGLRRLYDKAHDDGYELAVKEFEQTGGFYPYPTEWAE